MTREKDMTLKQTKHNTVIRNIIDKKGIKSKKNYGIKIFKKSNKNKYIRVTRSMKKQGNENNLVSPKIMENLEARKP